MKRSIRDAAPALLLATVVFAGLAAGASAVSAATPTAAESAAAEARASGPAANASGSPAPTSPAANSVLSGPPRQIVLPAAGTPTGRVVVYDSSHHAVATVAARPSGDTLVAPLPHLPRGAGIYSAVWQAGGQSGGFAFQVAPGGASPVLVASRSPTTR